ncbi:MAG TPA: hypothetical protein VFD33_02390 [Bacillota bacterium]|nr:hypothetical protein [Bacillota bacterium]
MIPYIKKYGPVRRRLRIKNRCKFIVFLLLILFTLLSIFIPKTGVGQINYRPFRVAYGDTYWDIAKDLQAQGYRSKADIRAVVHELVQKSGIPAHKLKAGDIIYLPDPEGLK